MNDLQPYSCIVTRCPQQKTLFESRNHWIKHLESEHEFNDHSQPLQCQMCLEWTGTGLVEICKLFLNHLKDIAMAASPLNATSADGSEADSTKSHGVLPDHAKDLPAITEEDEDDEGKSEQQPQSEMLGRHKSKNIFGDAAPNCAICNAPPYPECSCEEERIEIAAKQAEARCLNKKMTEIRYIFTFPKPPPINMFQELGD